MLVAHDCPYALCVAQARRSPTRPQASISTRPMPRSTLGRIWSVAFRSIPVHPHSLSRTAPSWRRHHFRRLRHHSHHLRHHLRRVLRSHLRCTLPPMFSITAPSCLWQYMWTGLEPAGASSPLTCYSRVRVLWTCIPTGSQLIDARGFESHRWQRDAWCSDPSAAATTYGDVNTWDISAVTDISFVWCKGPRVQDGCNADCANFNDDIGNWDVSKVTNMDQTFREAYDFNQDINNWDTSKVTNMQVRVMLLQSLLHGFTQKGTYLQPMRCKRALSLSLLLLFVVLRSRLCFKERRVSTRTSRTGTLQQSI